MSEQTFNGIDQALQDLNTLKAFRREDGLRVVRLDPPLEGDHPLGYGVGSSLMLALQDASESYLTHRINREGDKKLKSDDRTGMPQTDDCLDLWVSRGNILYAYLEGGLFAGRDRTIRVDAKTSEDETIAAVRGGDKGNDFKSCYNTLCQILFMKQSLMPKIEDF